MHLMQRQYRYVFKTIKNSTKLHNIVYPKLIKCSRESKNESNSTVVVDAVYDAFDMPTDIPNVKVAIDQKTGQVNILISKNDNKNRFKSKTAQLKKKKTTKQLDKIQKIAKSKSLLMREKEFESLDQTEITPIGMAIHTPNKQNLVSFGSIKTPNGSIWTPKGSLYTPKGTCYWPEDTQFENDGIIRINDGTIYTPSGFAYGKNGHLYSPQGTTYSPSGLAYSNKKGVFAWNNINEIKEGRLMYPELIVNPDLNSANLVSKRNFESQSSLDDLINTRTPSPLPLSEAEEDKISNFVIDQEKTKQTKIKNSHNKDKSDMNSSEYPNYLKTNVKVASVVNKKIQNKNLEIPQNNYAHAPISPSQIHLVDKDKHQTDKIFSNIHNKILGTPASMISNSSSIRLPPIKETNERFSPVNGFKNFKINNSDRESKKKVSTNNYKKKIDNRNLDPESFSEDDDIQSGYINLDKLDSSTEDNISDIFKW